jgi:HSP20 family protein
MDYIKIRFGDEFDHYKAQSEKSFDGMFQSLNTMFRLEKSTWKPNVDIYETETDIVVKVSMAGVDKEDMEIEISSKAIKITGKRQGSIPREKAAYRLAEIQYGSFERVLFLPCPIDTDKVTATYTNGFLHMDLGKLPVESCSETL